MTEQLVSTESSTPLNKFSGAQPKNTKEVAFKVGQNIAAMEVVAIDSSTGKYVTYAEGGSNGTDVAVGITAPLTSLGRGAGDANENFTFHGPYVAIKYVA